MCGNDLTSRRALSGCVFHQKLNDVDGFFAIGEKGEKVLYGLLISILFSKAQ
jgi:hypothetical protein